MSVEDIANLWKEEVPKNIMFTPSIPEDPPLALADFHLHSTHHYHPINHVFTYKKVANQVLPVPTVMPEYVKIITLFSLSQQYCNTHLHLFQGNDLHRNK